MKEGDITTIVVKRSPSGVFLKAIEKEWLQYLGFTDDELATDSVELVFKADVSGNKGIKYIGFGKPFKQNQKGRV